MRIRAVFTGENGSLGYQRGERYELDVTERRGAPTIRRPWPCPYGSWDAFWRNWSKTTIEEAPMHTTTIRLRRRPHEVFEPLPAGVADLVAPRKDLATGLEVGRTVTVSFTGVAHRGRVTDIDPDFITIECTP